LTNRGKFHRGAVRVRWYFGTNCFLFSAAHAHPAFHWFGIPPALSQSSLRDKSLGPKIQPGEYKDMSIQKKSLISTLKTTKKANVASAPASLEGVARTESLKKNIAFKKNLAIKKNLAFKKNIAFKKNLAFKNHLRG
jgi:hypothetical protein